MAKKKIPQTIEECNAELERTQKLLQQYENRNKMLNRKLSVEKRKERNHRIFLFGGFMESIVPELKTMTEDEGKYDITRHPNFKYTADADKRNTFDIEAFLSARLKLKPDEVCDVYEVDTEGV